MIHTVLRIFLQPYIFVLADWFSARLRTTQSYCHFAPGLFWPSPLHQYPSREPSCNHPENRRACYGHILLPSLPDPPPSQVHSVSSRAGRAHTRVYIFESCGKITRHSGTPGNNCAIKGRRWWPRNRSWVCLCYGSARSRFIPARVRYDFNI